MIRPSRKSALASVMLCWLVAIASPIAQAHGGVFLDEDQCVIQIGFFRAHFTVFQPRSRQHAEFCEDLPDVGETVFVLEYLHDGLQDMPIEFRIIRDVTGLGRFAKWTDILAIDDLEAATVFYQTALIDPDVLSVIHSFDHPGDYIGVVTSTHPVNDAMYSAVFPFTVGGTLPVVWLTIGAVLAMLALITGWRMAKSRGRPQHAARAVIALGIGSMLLPHASAAFAAASSSTGSDSAMLAASRTFRIEARPRLSPLVINTMHAWEIHLLRHDGTPVHGAQITVVGGMPEHDHGLPTSPSLTKRLPNGRYLIEGIKFHMNGAWEIALTIAADDVEESAIIKLRL